MRRWRASDARRQGGEASVAGGDVVKLNKLPIAAMIPALRDQLSRRVELLARLLEEPLGPGRVGQSGHRRARCDESVERSEGLKTRQR